MPARELDVTEHEYSYALPDRCGCNPYDPYLTMYDIREAKKNADYVAVIYHGGKEYCRYPSPRVRKLSHAMVQNGANVVLIQHTHCIGCYEEFEGSHIVYGQGNLHFVSERERYPMWYQSLLVEVDFVGEHPSIKFYPMYQKCAVSTVGFSDDLPLSLYSIALSETRSKVQATNISGSFSSV